MYKVDSALFTTESMHDGEWVTFHGDVLGHALAALQAAWDYGYLTDSTDLADYKLGGMTLGWEVSGLNVVSIQVRDVSVVAHHN